MRAGPGLRLACIILGLLAGSLSAENYVPLPSAAAYLGFLDGPLRSELLAKRSLSDAGGSLDELALWRRAPFAPLLRRAVAGRLSTLAAESWSVLDVPPVGGEERDLRIFRGFTAFSSMKGLRARSPIFDWMEDFLLESYRVVSAENPSRLPDPSEPSAPVSATYVLYGREALVGEVLYELRFASHETWFEVALSNLTPMKSLLFRLVEPRELITLFYVIPTEDRILLYGLTLAKTALIPGIAGIERRSLANRMMALGSWFEGNLARP
jgi:hypothetical protein